ncbi:hypothetical protein M0R45_028240 [Rubus argutus]|uniref:Peptidase A1 domain-containing protein n=1 Tax=Rubus argutus TaxID=59490 RepID=A0AAW1W6T9_RUBAR
MTESVMMISPSSTITNPESPLVLPSDPGQVFYVVVGIGTPTVPHKLTKVAFDTTSSVTWAQGVLSVPERKGSDNVQSQEFQNLPGIAVQGSECVRGRSPFHQVVVPATNSSRAPTLDFGPQAVISGDGIQTTPLLKVPGNLFSLNVTGISLNGKLVVDLLRLARAPSERGGSFVLDSIAPNTLMKQQDYHGLSQAVVYYI